MLTARAPRAPVFVDQSTSYGCRTRCYTAEGSGRYVQARFHSTAPGRLSRSYEKDLRDDVR